MTGCYAQTEPEKIKPIAGVDCIVGHTDKHNIPELILLHGQKQTHQIVTEPNENFFPTAIPASLRTRPVLKIQDGCNAFCTYCIVPLARGRSRSMPVSTVIKNLDGMHQKNIREVVLSGIHLGCYGHDLSPKTDLYRLLCEIDRCSAVERIRLSSIEPMELSDDIIDLVAGSQRFCHHFHIPMQSGDRSVLKKMNRPYSPEFFCSLVMRIHERIPNAAIGADVLVGFPGEEDLSFEATAALLQELPITYLHVFPFSPRKGTPAAGFPGLPPVAAVKERCSKIRTIGLKKKAAFYQHNRDIIHTVLIENRRDRKTNLLRGMTSNYIPILTEGPENCMNQLVSVTIEKIRETEVWGRLCIEKNDSCS